MKKNITLILFLFSLIAIAQVGIGKTNPNFILDINAQSLDLNGVNLQQTVFSAQLLAENSTNTFVFNHTNSTGMYNYRFNGTTRFILDNDTFFPAVNATDNLTVNGLDIGRFDTHFRRIYTQGVNTNDSDVNGGLRINIGAGGGVAADYMFSDFAFYPITDQNNELGRNGNFWLAAYSVNFFIPSDSSLKDNINSNSYGLSAVKKLKTYTYNYKTEKSKNLHFGFMAQELQKVLPNLVDKPVNGEGDLAVNYIEIVPVLVKAIQEQNQIIENKVSKINQLEIEIKMIKERLGI